VRDKWATDSSIDDLRPAEIWAWSPLLVGILALGIYPRAIFDITNGAVTGLARLFT
jgi:NADH:ubiquinone oxidoreductase subunit 4 (subunit M)